MAKQKKGVKIMAFLALFGITIGIVGTGVLVLLSGNNNSSEQKLSPEQYLELQKIIETQSGETIEINTNTLTGETK